MSTTGNDEKAWGTRAEPMTDSDWLRVLALEFPHPKRSAQCYSLSTAFLLPDGIERREQASTLFTLCSFKGTAGYTVQPSLPESNLGVRKSRRKKRAFILRTRLRCTSRRQPYGK